MKRRSISSEKIEAPFGNPLLAFGPALKPIPLPADSLAIYTDGSCGRSPGQGGWGFVVYRGTEEIHEASGGAASTTNNRMELQAVIEALCWLGSDQPGIIWTDSAYVICGWHAWRRGWKRENWSRRRALANADLWQTVGALLANHVVDVRWTRGHVGTAGNERADALAAIGRASAAVPGAGS